MNKTIKYETFITSEGMIKKVTYHGSEFSRVYSKRDNGNSYKLIKDGIADNYYKLPLTLLQAIISEDVLRISNAIEACMLADEATEPLKDKIVTQ